MSKPLGTHPSAISVFADRVGWLTILAAGLLAASFYLAAGNVRAQEQTAQVQRHPEQSMPADKHSATRDPGTAKDGYRLGSGDRMRITVFGQPELTGEYSVDGGGQLSFPLIGSLQAGGMTAGELEGALIGKLKPDYLTNPSVSVEILTYRPFYIVGEIRAPGSYPYVNGMTVLNAVALAGGFTYRARESSFYVTRSVTAGGKARLEASPDTPILPGDIVTVRERYF